MSTPPPAAGHEASPFSSRGIRGKAFASNGKADRTAATRLRKGIGGLLADAIELVELQVSLFQLNAHQAKEKAIWPIAFLSIGSVLALAAMPLLLVAIAFAIAEFASMDYWAAFGLTFVVAVLLGGIAAYIAFRQLVSLTHTFDDSTDELSRNLTWLKSSLRDDDRPQAIAERERYDNRLKEQMEEQMEARMDEQKSEQRDEHTSRQWDRTH